MKHRAALLLALVLTLSLCSCGPAPGPSPTPSSDPTSAASPAPVPPYSLINSDEYVSGSSKGVGYRVEIGDGATDEDMRAVFAELAAVGSYDIHTVWFYGLASDVEAVGAYTVGMIEEPSPGEAPVFTAADYDAATLAALRERAQEGEEARSVPSPSVAQEALVPDNSFMAAPGELFTTPAEENGLGDRAFYAEGMVEEVGELAGSDAFRLSTDAGEIWVSAVVVPLGGVAQGDEIAAFFVYLGWSDELGMAVGSYVYHE